MTDQIQLGDIIRCRYCGQPDPTESGECDRCVPPAPKMNNQLSKQPKLKPEATFGDLPVGARFIVPWTSDGETFVKIAASNCGLRVGRNTITKLENLDDSVRVRQVGDATTLPKTIDLGVDGPRLVTGRGD